MKLRHTFLSAFGFTVLALALPAQAQDKAATNTNGQTECEASGGVWTTSNGGWCMRKLESEGCKKLESVNAPDENGIPCANGISNTTVGAADSDNDANLDIEDIPETEQAVRRKR
jgi:hypothetical protein